MKKTRDTTDHILDAGTCTGQVDGLRACGTTDGMFFHGLFAKFWQKIKIELSFFTDILLPEQVKKLVHSVQESAPFYLT